MYEACAGLIHIFCFCLDGIEHVRDTIKFRFIILYKDSCADIDFFDVVLIVICVCADFM